MFMRFAIVDSGALDIRLLPIIYGEEYLLLLGVYISLKLTIILLFIDYC
jgi:hypothetical protein